MKTTKSTLETVAIYSDDNQHRYLLQKTWDSSKKKAMVIMIFPCSSDITQLDLTTMLVLNNLAKLDYGSVDILNLFSKTDANPSKDLASINTPDNDKQILTSAETADSIIIAWGKSGDGSKKIMLRQRAVLKLLEPHKEKVFTTVDERGVAGLHPLTPTLRHGWKLEPFNFPAFAESLEGEKSGKTDDKDSKPQKHSKKAQNGTQWESLPDRADENTQPQEKVVTFN